MLKHMLFIASIFAGSLVHADVPPSGCKEWRWQGDKEYARWDKVQKYGLANHDYEYVVHASRCSFSDGVGGCGTDDIRFYNEEDGFLGEDDTSSTSGDADMVYNLARPGKQFVWFYRGNEWYGECAYTDVYTQTMQPQVVLNGALKARWKQVDFNLGFEVDPYSKARMEANENAKLTINWIGQATRLGGSKTFELTDQLGSHDFRVYPQARGRYNFYATLSDGTFATRVTLGTVFVDGPDVLPRPCPTCPPY